ncbi:uncharacterized protein LOC100167172 isoform X2 [Acyrthosiphon pisum]|uniref:Vezatin n=1 Tax=Acyrthosiphon pisum TaxID=7029 RepID=A0A8R2H7V9_ACYPI|nr:uncharacterized protein LOC100167172 isoform X2 [Acyrthosiphon pisum]|eukprot:XP_016662271.1 PREDICTED: uncharacterized protein LOC100167172 isoform X2 [Acyrthosiphon pisum]
MEIDDEDVVVDGTDLQKYLNAVGYSEFEVSKRKPGEKLCPTEVQKCSRKIMRPTQNQKDFALCVTLIKIIMESQLIFKEDTLFIKEFIPSEHFKYPLFLTKRKSITLLILCVFCGLMNMFFSKFWDEWTIVGMFIFWFGCVLMDVLYNLNQNRAIKNTTMKTIQSMEKLSLLIQKSTHFVQECSNIHNSCFHTYDGKNPNAFKYLLMPELRTLLITVLQDLINNLVYNISEVHTFFPLKDSVSNIVYLYKTDCKIDLKNTSFENINKAKYTYFLLQSEFLKQSALCLCPALWTPHSFFHLNRLIETIEHSKQPVQCTNMNSDLKLKIYSIRQFLQNMMVHVRFMEDSFENSSVCNIDDINSTLNILLKDVSVFNELISTLQINILKKNNNQTDKSILTNDSIGVTDHIDTDTNEPIKEICEDELFFGVSEEPTENMENTFCNEVLFDKSNNHNLMLELKVALKDKQAEWKQRECKLLEKHPQLNDLSDDDESNETQARYINKVRKVALDLPPDESFSMQLPDKSFASEIAMVAYKRNTAIECFGDDSDSSTSINSNDS